MTDGHLFIKSHLQRPEPSTPGGHREALLCPGPDAPAGPKWAGAAGRARASGLLPGTPCSGQRWRSPPGGSRPARSADLSLRYRAGPPTPPPALPRPGSAEPSALRCASRRLAAGTGGPQAQSALRRLGSPRCGVGQPVSTGPSSHRGSSSRADDPPPRPHRVPGRQALLRAEGLVPRPRRPRPPGGAAAQPCGWDRGATRPPRAASAWAETEPPGASGT